MDLKEENILKDEIAGHWYYKSKASALLRLVNDKEYKVILDIGARSGFFTKNAAKKQKKRIYSLCSWILSSPVLGWAGRIKKEPRSQNVTKWFYYGPCPYSPFGNI